MSQTAEHTARKRPITIHDLASRLGVSATTVSRAINNRGRMADETRQRIIKTASEHNYTPSLVAQTLVGQRTKTLGVVVPMIGDTVYSQMVRGVEQVAFEHGYNITLCDTDIDLKREKDYLDMLISRRVEGVIVVPFANRSDGDEEHLLATEAHGIPVVVMEEELNQDRLTQVMVSTYQAAKQITNHLIALGHRRIGFLRYEPESWDANGEKRFRGYRDALVEADLSFDPELVLNVGSIQGCPFVAKRVEAYLRSPERPTAIFGVHDGVAAQALAVIHDLGLNVPDDLAVVGFDDAGVAAVTYPPLTTMCQPARQLGRRAAELLFERIKLGPDMPNWPRRECLPCELVVRKSCGDGNDIKKHEEK